MMGASLYSQGKKLAMDTRLDEKDFIQESKNGSTWKIWLGIVLALSLFLTGVWSIKWIADQTEKEISRQPFLRVTNRAFSLFLWENTEYMRPHRKSRTGYLPGFHLNPKVTPKPEQAEGWVSVPPDVLFHYHSWERLLREYEYDRLITAAELREFLAYAEEWHPDYWEESPEGYREFVLSLPVRGDVEEVQASVPPDVKRAFIGWKNYFKEGEEINRAIYAKDEVKRFLKRRPHFAAHFWQNSYPGYLKSLENDIEKELPGWQIPSFMKVALYNDGQSPL
jgi:hypothetical protein